MLGDLGKLIVAKGFKKLPKIQKIARSGHTASEPTNTKRTEKRGDFTCLAHYFLPNVSLVLEWVDKLYHFLVDSW